MLGPYLELRPLVEFLLPLSNPNVLDLQPIQMILGRKGMACTLANRRCLSKQVKFSDHVCRVCKYFLP